MKVVGVGWAKTGTTSLGEALKLLGFRHKTQELALTDSLDIPGQQAIWHSADAYDSFEDWPWLLLYREFDERYPGSKFILTVRDPDSWLISYRKQLDRAGKGPQATAWRRRLYGLPFPEVSDEQLVERYLRHQTDVRAYFDGRPGDFLVVDWTRGDGWNELCGFLAKPIPDCAFPRANVAPPGNRRSRSFAARAAGKIKRMLLG